MVHWSKLRWHNLYLPPTRFVEREYDLPLTPRPYSSMLDDVRAQGERQKVHNAEQYVALHSVKLHAGQVDRSYGESGRPAAAKPILLPELLGGRIHATNV
ncbi:hypothetical protein LJC46_02945 [Desulfovibrio sp. OttesenSCG-928-G15]|nr:hypothetical protein [Desulfovibrio sp. OttesenSCG-928-G15]